MPLNKLTALKSSIRMSSTIVKGTLVSCSPIHQHHPCDSNPDKGKCTSEASYCSLYVLHTVGLEKHESDFPGASARVRQHSQDDHTLHIAAYIRDALVPVTTHSFGNYRLLPQYRA
jgi:hypothetical protein